MPLSFGEFEISLDTYELRRAGRPVHVEPRVFEVLAYLVEHRPRVVSKEELFEKLWPGEFVSDSALARAVRDARRALGDTGAKERWIETVYGRGFRFTGEPANIVVPLAGPSSSPALAVLPLEDLSRQGEEEFFADGMTDALITELARVGSLRVSPRSSAMRYKGSRRPLRDIAAELGVEYAVEGTVLRDGERVRISAQLLRTATGEHLWAERYERQLRDVLSLQAELACTIARAIDVQLTPQEHLRLGRRRQVEPRVYLLDLEGRHFLAKRNEESFRKALACFRGAAELDPTYAPAQAGVAEAYAMLGNYGISPPGEVHGPARAAAEHALAIDPGLAEARRTLALLHWQFEFDWRAAELEYQRALELDPKSASVRWWYGVCQGIQGRFEDSLEELARARALDPWSLHVVALEGWMRYFDRRPGEALAYYRGVLEVDPNHLMSRWFLGEALVELGLHEAARLELEAALDLSGRSSRMLGYLGYAHGRAGRGPEARDLLDELETRRKERYVPRYFSALVFAGLGENASALDELNRAWQERDSMLRDLKVDPPWERLHGEPRYQEIRRRVGLG
jgi:TolB-like protein/Tfp pilus assembly protein PilF